MSIVSSREILVNSEVTSKLAATTSLELRLGVSSSRTKEKEARSLRREALEAR